MRERPLVLTAADAQKVYLGCKTQTRRIVTWPAWVTEADKLKLAAQRPHATGLAYYQDGHPKKIFRCPYGNPGDHIWIREAWASLPHPNLKIHGPLTVKPDLWPICYGGEYPRGEPWPGTRWEPAIRMPRWACRSVREIVSVLVERLQEISETDAIAEGCVNAYGPDFHVGEFRKGWNSIHGPDAWDRNEWVWVIEWSGDAKRTSERQHPREATNE